MASLRTMLHAVYAVLCYALFMAVFLYAIAFVGDFGVGKTIDAPAGLGGWAAPLVNTLLLLVFALQHSVMARPGFKRWWAAVVPPSIERSTYVLVSSLVLGALFLAWQPMPAVVWDLRATAFGPLLSGLAWLGWLICLLSTFMISHFELFGLSQAWRRWKNHPASQASFKEVLFYRFVRHPLMTGFLIAFWATPRMTQGHLLFAFLMSAYILVGVWLEERDLLEALGDRYRQYRERVPMLVPFLRPCRSGR